MQNLCRVSLAVYRLAFGQPRQDDLLDYLQSLSGEEMTAEDLADLQIRLEPNPLQILGSVEQWNSEPT
jgi:hypothetical protein